MTLAPEFLGGLVNKHALEFGLKPEVVMCVVIQESAGNPLAHRYESDFYDRYLKGKARADLSGFVPTTITLDTELHDRAFSWGLMQVMGETARSIGRFSAPELPALLDANIGLFVGCRVLRYYLDAQNGEYSQALCRYNAGSVKSAVGQAYASQVLGRVTEKQHVKYFRG